MAQIATGPKAQAERSLASRAAKLLWRGFWPLVVGSLIVGVPPWSGVSVRAQAPADNRPASVTAVNFSNGKVLLPRTGALLTVLVANSNGQPLRDVEVLFVAPASPPTGGFAGAPPGQTTLLRTRTGGNGEAAAIFLAGEPPGVFLVDALVEASGVGTSFAVTSLPQVFSPATSAEQARRAVKQELLRNLPEGEALELHGPVLLPPGTSVAAAGLSSFFFPTEPAVADKLVWFFWIDFFPAAGFAHPTRYVFVDATRPVIDFQRDVRLTREGWWPEVTLPRVQPVRPPRARAGPSEANSLLPPWRTNTGVVSGATPPSGPAALAAFPAATQVLPDDTCAIVIYGPPDSAHANTAEDVREFLNERIGVPTANTYTGKNLLGFSRPASVFMLASFIDAVRQKRCKKLYLSITAHGSEGSNTNTCTGARTPGGDCGSGYTVLANAQNNGREYLSYEELANMLEPLQQIGTEICMIVDACYSAGVIAHLQNRGLNGLVVTSADTSGQSTFPPNAFGRPTDFVGALLDAWSDPAAVPRPAECCRSLGAAFEWVLANGGSRALNGNPQRASIDPSGGVFPLPSVVIPNAGGAVAAQISRPADAVGDYAATFKVQDPGVADFDGGAETRKVSRAGGAAVQLGIRGLRDGVTLYTAEAVDLNNKLYRGTASILVGSGYYVLPNPLRLTVGETKSAALFRHEILRRLPGTFPVQAVPQDAASAAIAVATPPLVNLPKDRQGEVLYVTGLRPGTATMVVTDLLLSISTSFLVIVEAAPPQTGCLLRGTFDLQFAVASDPGGHDPSIRLRQASVRFSAEGNQASVSSETPQVVPATGPFNQTTCGFSATGTGTVAGFPNVRCEYRDVVISGIQNATIRGQYALGVDGRLPGGQAIIYNFTGTLRPGTGSTAGVGVQ